MEMLVPSRCCNFPKAKNGVEAHHANPKWGCLHETEVLNLDSQQLEPCSVTNSGQNTTLLELCSEIPVIQAEK